MDLAGPTIGLTVPDRPPTPCDGRAQHYRRPGNPARQQTRTFPNGTSLTFGTEDFVDTIQPGEPFHEQNLVIEAAKEVVKAVRRSYRLEDSLESAVDDLTLDTIIPLDPASINRIDLQKKVNIDVSGESVASGQLSSGNSTNSGYINYMARQAGLTEASGDKMPELPASEHVASNTNVYQNFHPANIPGAAHPGFSNDIRGALGWHDPRNSHAWATLGAPGGGLSGFNKIKGFGEHRYGSGAQPAPVGLHFSHLHMNKLLHSDRFSAVPIQRSESESIQDTMRWAEIQRDLMHIAADPDDYDQDLIHYYRINPPEPTNHPQVMDVYGPVDEYQKMMDQNVNPLNKGKYVPRPYSFDEHGEPRFDQPIIPMPILRQPPRPSRMQRRHIDRNQPSIFIPDGLQLPTWGTAQDIGYGFGGTIQQGGGNRSPISEPSRHGRGRQRSATRKGARGGLYHAEAHPFQGRFGRGLPRFEGPTPTQTFNERIGLIDSTGVSSSAGSMKRNSH